MHQGTISQGIPCQHQSEDPLPPSIKAALYIQPIVLQLPWPWLVFLPTLTQSARPVVPNTITVVPSKRNPRTRTTSHSLAYAT
jgi:hypothetical protein